MDELGRGATGVVYRAQDPAIGRNIAIKTIRLSDFTDEGERDRLRERLFREAQSAGVLSHPNIVTIYDIAEENGLAYIFMECVDGPPLEKVLNSQHALDRNYLMSLLRQTAVALDYAHKKGIVHRDIKPANILIHDGPIAKITDFGVAKILSQQMTHSGVMMGTPNYMSPEQVQGHAIDGRADQFSLAVIAYEILTGEKPFVADQLPSLLYRIVREDPVPPERLNPSLAPQVEVVLRKALSKSAADRYPNCSEFIEALAVACNVNPGWHALPRTVAQSMPTVGGGAPIASTRVPAPPPAPSVPAPVIAPSAPPARPFRAETEGEARNPMLKSLVWMLVGLGLVGLLLYGAQKYLFNRSSDSSATPVEAQQPPPKSSEPAPVKPSPVGDSQAAEESAKAAPKAEAPPESTSPEKPSPVAETPRDTEPARPAPQRSSSPPPVVAPPVVASKSDGTQSIQFVTDPPNAQLTVDANSSLTCNAPCMLAVSPGRHSITVRLDGYRPYPRVFNVPQDREIFLQLSKASGTLSITSSPAGASIEINGERQSKQTPAIFNFAPGNYRVKVARNGAFLEFEVQLRDGEFVNKKVDF